MLKCSMFNPPRRPTRHICWVMWLAGHIHVSLRMLQPHVLNGKLVEKKIHEALDLYIRIY